MATHTPLNPPSQTALAHLDLPGELDLVGDVQVDLEVAQVTHALVVEGVQALNDQNLRSK
jgi:hypothetical protein